MINFIHLVLAMVEENSTNSLVELVISASLPISSPLESFSIYKEYIVFLAQATHSFFSNFFEYVHCG